MNQSPQSSSSPTPHYDGNSHDQVEELFGLQKQIPRPEINLNETWEKGGLRIIYYITKFIRQIKTHASLLKFKLLTEHVLSFIDDNAGDIKEILKLK
jgi:hypothetical protein